MISEKHLKTFWRQVNKDAPEPRHVSGIGNCWEWTGCKSDTGYGSIRANDKPYNTHKFSWLIHFGRTPNDMCVCHKCDNRACVRPDHLFLASRGDNLRDCAKKNRFPLNSRHHYTKLTSEQVAEIKTLRAAGESAIEIAQRFSVSRSHVTEIIAGRKRTKFKINNEQPV